MRRSSRQWWLAAAVGLAACGSGSEAPPPEVDLESVDPQGQEVVFWYQHQRAREQALLEMIADFNETNSHGIRVRGEFAGSYGDIYNKMVVGLQGGSVADLVVAYQNQAREYLLADGIVDLAQYMTSPRWGLSQEEAADYVQAFLRQDRIGGRQIALPPNRSIEVLYHNIDWLRELGAGEPPATWEEFARLCRAARDRPFSGKASGSRSLGFVLDEDASRVASMTFSRGGDFLDPEGASYRLDTPETAASLRLMQELVAEGAVELMGEAYGDQTAFNVGEALFMLRSTSGIPFVQEGVASGAGVRLGSGGAAADGAGTRGQFLRRQRLGLPHDAGAPAGGVAVPEVVHRASPAGPLGDGEQLLPRPQEHEAAAGRLPRAESTLRQRLPAARIRQGGALPARVRGGPPADQQHRGEGGAGGRGGELPAPAAAGSRRNTGGLLRRWEPQSR